MILEQFSVFDALEGKDSTFYNTQNRIYDETKFSLLRKCDNNHQLFKFQPESASNVRSDDYKDRSRHSEKQFDLHVRAMQSAHPKAVKRYKDASSS